MGVDASRADCKEPLVNDHLQKDDGSAVQVSRCPKCEGKMKSSVHSEKDFGCAA
jgi:hypothetical protein